ncbi:methyltransferase family protein [Pseudonocardia hierapolitana]|uniref:Methyltransferase family protein n=1 Tax=Pseudonocardia hierapolitana TaxID=1128676 RepID=A0A561SS47_9PSEU|nr:class I SAM-dependent methyltransferase [Pseudonocardia hierapolitana]TWF77655.1 methyltransferase family protein [Pseudonocardia hierapolitana]
MPEPRDYDADPERYRLGMRVTAAHCAPGVNLQARIVEHLLAAGVTTVLDAGCGDGALAAGAAGYPLEVIGLDAAVPMVAAARAHGPVVRGDIAALPVADASVDAVVMVNVLYHLDRPAVALREARRVLRPDGLFVAGTVARSDSPELAPFWRPTPGTFDAENAGGIVAAVFGAVTVEAWDAPLVTLPDRDAVRDYLRARFVPPDDAGRLADAVAARGPLPLPVTKRGALLLARH